MAFRIAAARAITFASDVPAYFRTNWLSDATKDFEILMASLYFPELRSLAVIKSWRSVYDSGESC